MKMTVVVLLVLVGWLGGILHAQTNIVLQNTTLTGLQGFCTAGTITAGSNVNPGQLIGPVVIEFPGIVGFYAQQSIHLEAGFRVEAGNYFEAKVKDCDASGSRLAAAAAEAPWTDEGSNGLSVSPNPFIEDLVLEYRLEAGAQVEAHLVNLQGKQVATLIPAGLQAAGAYQLSITLQTALPAGIYFLRMQVGKQTWNRKLIHL